MTYSISILRKAQKELSKLPKQDYENVKTAIFKLAEQPRPNGCSKLKGREGWRVRVGDYRIIYEITDKKLIVLVLDIGHRKFIYK